MEGCFMEVQYPVYIPGVSNIKFLRTAMNQIKIYRNLPAMESKEFLKMVKEKQKLVEFDAALTNRSLNEGFSGGEKKRNEIFQLAMLDPKLVILYETDSGLDIDALRIVSNGVNKLRSEKNAFVIITHYQRLLDYIVPDFVHVLYNGQIVNTGGKELALELEEKGYDWLKEESKEKELVYILFMIKQIKNSLYDQFSADLELRSIMSESSEMAGLHELRTSSFYQRRRLVFPSTKRAPW